MREREEDDVKKVAVRERAREDTFKIVIAVVIILLLFNTIVIIYFVHPAFNPEDEGDVKDPPLEGDWLIAAEPLNITQDEVWQDLDITLERPVAIKDNATLDIRDSHIRVLLEDLMFWLLPAFSVEPGSKLTLTSSTIEVHQDPRLEASVFGPYARPDNNIPYIARVVNLEHAADPVLHFDVQWPWDATQLAIGVLPTNDSEMVLLERYMPDVENRPTWTHLEVGLADFVGTQPWVVIWHDIYPTSPALIGNLEVLDGDHWPRGDAFPTGHPQKDGWAISRYYDLPYIQRTDFSRYDLKGLEHSWQPLIDNKGDLEMTSSHLVEPSGMGRRASPDIYKEAIDPMLMRTVNEVGARGGHVNVMDGTFQVSDGSTLTNVPISGIDSSVLFSDSDLRGDHDLVSLHNASGGFKDCTFTIDTIGPDHPFSSNRYRYLWGLALEGTFFSGIDSFMDPDFSVSDCEFTGTPMALDLTDADVLVTGNTFQDIPSLAIWDHRSTRLGDWEELERTNTFGPMGRTKYMRSTVADVDFVYPGINESDIRVYSSSPIHSGIDSPFSGQSKFFYQNRARYIVPETVVTRTGEVQTSQRVRTDIGYNGTSQYFVIPKGTTQMTVDLEELFTPEPVDEGQKAPMELWVFKPSYGPDVYEVLIAITELQELRVTEPTMRFSIDSAIVEEVNLTDDQVEGGQLFVWENLTLLPGWRDLEVSVWGNEWLGGDEYSDDPVEIDTLSIPLLMMAPFLEFEPWMPLEADYVVVPEGRSASIDHLEPRAGSVTELNVNVRGWEGSSVSIDCGGLPKDTDIIIDHSSDLSIEVHNASVRDLTVKPIDSLYQSTSTRATTTVHDVVADILGVSGAERDISVTRVHVDFYLAVSTEGNSNVVVADSTVSEADGHIFSTHGNVTLRNCTFSSHWDRVMIINPMHANVTMMECTVVNSSIMIYFENFYRAVPERIDISDCHFSGDEALLYVGWDINHVDSYDIDPSFVPLVNGSITGNTFNGPNTHVVLSHGQFENLWRNNVLEDGANLHAFFITRLQVIPPDGTPFWGAYTFLPVEGIITDWPFQAYRWVELDGEILIDFLEYSKVEVNPPTLEVLLYSKYGNYRIVRGFGRVIPDEDNDEATYPVYPNYQSILQQNLIYWPPLENIS